MSNFLKSLLGVKDAEIKEDIGTFADTFDAQSIHDKLDSAAEADEVETITFGLETDDGNVIKVYVAVEDAEAFELALGEKLGEEDNIEILLDELSKKYDIVDVDWPGEDEDEDENIENDGSESLNDKVKYDEAEEEDYFEDDEIVPEPPKAPKSLGQLFVDKLVKEGIQEADSEEANDTEVEEADIGASAIAMDPANQEFLDKWAKNSHQRLGLSLLMSLGIDAKSISVLKQRNPTIVKDIGLALKAAGAAGRNKIANVFGIDVTEDQELNSAAEFLDIVRDNLKEESFNVDKNEDGSITFRSDDEIMTFNADAVAEIITGVGEQEVVTVNDSNGDGPYVFSPREDSYLVKTPSNIRGFTVSMDDISKIIGE